MIDPYDVDVPEVPPHKTKYTTFDPTAVLWDPPKKSQPGKVIWDPNTQRATRDQHRKDISAAWNIAIADPAHISVRKDGTKSIMDGAHETWAAADNGVKSLHCIEHYDLTIPQECVFHLRHQSDRKADYAADKWPLKVKAEIPEYVAAQKMLARYGITVGRNQTIQAAGSVDFVVKEYGADVLEQVVKTMNAWCKGAPTKKDWTANASIRALGFLHAHHPLVATPEKLGDKLSKKKTPQDMERDITNTAKGGGGTRTRYLVGARLIADIWNVRRAISQQYPIGILGVVLPSDEEEGDEDEE